MKQTTTINLCGQVFHIDTDAFSTLDEYLKSIDSHLQQSDSKEEIMQDIEARIAELFQEHLQYGHMEVVNISMVNDIMAQLGSPEMISDGQEEADEHTQQEEPQAAPQTQHEEAKCKKKLFRDLENAKLGGVCAGLGEFVGIDPIWFRLIMILLTLLYGTSILIYLLMCLIVPAADTTARRLEMRGIEPSAENIQHEVEKMQAEGRPAHTQKHSTGHGCLIALLIAFGVIFLLPIIGIIFFVMAMVGVGFATIPLMGASAIGAGVLKGGIVMLICLIVAVIMPIIALIAWLVDRKKGKKSKTAFWITILVIWLLALIGATTSGYHVANNFDEDAFEQKMDEWGDQMDEWGDQIDALEDSINALESDTANWDEWK